LGLISGYIQNGTGRIQQNEYKLGDLRNVGYYTVGNYGTIALNSRISSRITISQVGRKRESQKSFCFYIILCSENHYHRISSNARCSRDLRETRFKTQCVNSI